MTDIVKQQVVRLASSGRGFRVLVPDLYHGVVGVDMEEAGHVSRTAGRVLCRTAGHMPSGNGRACDARGFWLLVHDCTIALGPLGIVHGFFVAMCDCAYGRLYNAHAMQGWGLLS